MLHPVQITFRGVSHSQAIANAIEKRAHKLEELIPGINMVRVVVAAPNHHRRKGNSFHVRTDISLGRKYIVVDREPEKNEEHEDLYVAIRDAFDAAERQMQGFRQRRRQNHRRGDIPSGQ